LAHGLHLRNPWPLVAASAVLAMLLLASGCRTTRSVAMSEVLSAADLAKTVEPSNARNWPPNLALLPRAVRNAQLLTVYNIRNTSYLTADDYVVRHYDKTFDLNQLRTLDFVVVPFKDSPAMAHTMLSFGFGQQGHLALSVEARLEQDETYSPVQGAMRQYELMYILADERDVILLRTKYRKDDVYLYPTKATPEQVRIILLDVMARANKLAVEPEFYDTFTNNCTTNIVGHINRLRPNRIPFSMGVLLPGYADRLAYDLGLLDTDFSFEKTHRDALISRLANRYAESPDFSEKIRRR
jgi:hypothetical protein